MTQFLVIWGIILNVLYNVYSIQWTVYIHVHVQYSLYVHVLHSHNPVLQLKHLFVLVPSRHPSHPWYMHKLRERGFPVCFRMKQETSWTIALII